MDQLKRLFPFPQNRPNLPFNPSGWFPECNQSLIAEEIAKHYPTPKIILELGSWVGMSSRWILDHAPDSVLICMDHWNGSPENAKDPLVPILYEQFITNCWDYRNRIIPMRLDTKQGLPMLLNLGIKPAFCYVDAGHDYDSAKWDIQTCFKFGCPLIGDDFNPRTWVPVITAVWDCAHSAKRDIQVRGSAWKIS